MNRSISLRRYLSTRLIPASAAFLIAVFLSAAAHGQSTATINLSSPTTITSCFAPSIHDRSEPRSYFIDVESTFGVPAQNRTLFLGLHENATTRPSPSQIPRLSDESIFRILDLDPAIFEPSDPKLADSKEEQARLGNRKAKFLQAARVLLNLDAEQALSLFDKAREGDARVPPASLLAARLVRGFGNPEFHKTARGLLDQAAFDDPHAPEPPLEAAAWALDDDRLADAVAQLDRCLSRIHEAAPSRWSPAYRKNLFMRAYTLQAETYRRAEKWDLIEAVAVEWLAIDPDAPRASAARGEAAYQNDSVSSAGQDAAYQRFDEAYRESLKRAHLAEPAGELAEVPPPEMQLAQLAARLGHQETAALWIRRLRDKLPSYVKAEPREQLRSGMFLARWSFEREDWTEARRAYEAATAMPSPPPSSMPTSLKDDREVRRFAAELAYFEQSPNGIDELTRLFVEMPDDVTVADYLARALAESRVPADQERALRVARANQAGHPTSASARCTLAWVHLRAERTAEAVALINPVLETPPTLTPDDAYILARILFEPNAQSGRIATVVDLLRQIAQSTGPSRYRKLAKTWLDILVGT